MTLGHPNLPELSESGCRATREILERIGDKWTLYVVGSLREGPQRFNELRRAVDGVSQRMLTLTLRGLERDGLVTRTVFPCIPPRVDYELTELGRTLLEPVAVLIQWAQASRPAIEAARARFDDPTRQQARQHGSRNATETQCCQSLQVRPGQPSALPGAAVG